MEDFVKLLGTATAHANGTTMTITIPAGGIPVGDFILVAVASDYTTGGPTVTDDHPRSTNNYVRDKSAPEGTDLRVSWLCCVVTTALSARHHLTITTSAEVVARAAIALQFTGVSATLDGSSNGSSDSSKNPTQAGFPATTSTFTLPVLRPAKRRLQA